MNWSKAKNWLIVLFIGVNLFLVFTIIRTNVQSSTIDRDTIANIVNILQENGIAVEADVIPQSMPDLGPIDVMNSLSDYDALAALVLDANAQKAADKPEYTSGSKRLWFEGDMIYYEDSSPQQPYEGLSQNRAQSIALELLRTYGFNMERAQASAAEQADGEYIVTVTQKIDQYVLFDSYFYVHIAPEGLRSFAGSWFVPSGSQDILTNESARVKSIVSVLLDFTRNEERIQNGSSQIVQIDLGYMTKAKDTYHKNATAMPVWLIRCSDGKVYDYEAR